MAMKKRITMYWLLPAKAEAELFRRLIRILADEFEGPTFQPHLTLGTATTDAPAKVLRHLKAQPVRLKVRGTAHSTNFTKTLFVRLKPTGPLEKLVKQLGANGNALSDPHVSFLYKKLPVAIRRELAATIKLPFTELTFDSIAAVNCVSPTETPADVRSWRKLATKRLSG
jgi:hypothetical protein